MKTVPELLREAASLYEERNELYKNNYKMIGGIYEILFPDGIELTNAPEFNRFGLLVQVVGKLLRYTYNYDNPDPDHLKDMIVYATMLHELDREE